MTVPTLPGPSVSAHSYPKPDPANLPDGAYFTDFDGPAGTMPEDWICPCDDYTWPGSMATMKAENAFLDGNGNLVVKAKKDETGAWTSALVELVPRLGYGYYYASMKPSAGPGVHSSFWALGDTHQYGVASTWPNCGENDICECVGDGKYHSGVHVAYPNNNNEYALARSGNLLFNQTTAFHRYYCRKLSFKVNYGVDTTFVGDVNSSLMLGADFGDLNRPQKVIFSISIGDTMAGNPTAATPVEPTTLIDWFCYVPEESITAQVQSALGF